MFEVHITSGQMLRHNLVWARVLRAMMQGGFFLIFCVTPFQHCVSKLENSVQRERGRGRYEESEKGQQGK